MTFDRIRVLADGLAEEVPDLRCLLESVQKSSGSRRRLRRLALRAANDSKEASLVRTLRDQLSPYTVNVPSHLRGLSLAERWDRVLATSEEQYHHYMLEVELVNRLNAATFSRCEMRLAFLPHCLHDQSVTCKSVVRGEDHMCKGCSKMCVLNAVSKLLRRHRVTPYIWMTANLRSLLRRLHKEGKTVAVLGIACVPELVRGMRTCMHAGVPVMGLPLDANRCARWWGRFYPNSANLQELERLLLKSEQFDDC
ncbi:MAG: DUF116 domain-containing protein [Bacteroidetes bacterium]|nr:DUF116 domain-containing protein [Bacteroidota bacterium]